MSDSLRAARGMIANAAALAVSFLVAFFLLPVVVGTLGPVRYGIWVIIGALVSYLGLLDLGLRTAVTTYVARDHAVGNHRGASETVSTALWTRRWVGLVALGGAVASAAVLDRVLTIPSELIWEARAALVAYALAVVVSLMGGVFAGVLQGINRQDVVAMTTIVHTVVRAVGTVVLMRQGYSLPSLAILEAAAAVIVNALIIQRCLRLYPELRLSFLPPSRRTLSGLGTYSGQLVLWQILGRIITAGPSLVIGATLSPAAVTLYALGAYLLDAAHQVRMAVTPTFMPLAARYDAAGNRSALRALFQRGTRLALIALLPILVGLITRGGTFLGLWIGNDYSGPAGQVLRVLTVGAMLTSAVAAAPVILLGLARQREALFWSGAQAAATLLLSVALARRYGIVGVAWAATVPTVFGVALTRAVCRLVDVSLLTYVRTSWGRPALTALPFAISCILLDRYWEANSIPVFLAQMAAAFPIYVFSCMLFMAEDLAQGWSLLRGPIKRNLDSEPVA